MAKKKASKASKPKSSPVVLEEDDDTPVEVPNRPKSRFVVEPDLYKLFAWDDVEPAEKNPGPDLRYGAQVLIRQLGFALIQKDNGVFKGLIQMLYQGVIKDMLQTLKLDLTTPAEQKDAIENFLHQFSIDVDGFTDEKFTKPRGGGGDGSDEPAALQGPP